MKGLGGEASGVLDEIVWLFFEEPTFYHHIQQPTHAIAPNEVTESRSPQVESVEVRSKIKLINSDPRLAGLWLSSLVRFLLVLFEPAFHFAYQRTQLSYGVILQIP